MQVAFLEEDSLSATGFWFITERVCDVLFGCDVIINFNTAVWADEATHGSLELSRGVIARRYIASGRAPVDILCTIPWDLVAQTLAGADPGDGAGGGAPHAHRAKAGGAPAKATKAAGGADGAAEAAAWIAKWRKANGKK